MSMRSADCFQFYIPCFVVSVSQRNNVECKHQTFLCNSFSIDFEWIIVCVAKYIVSQFGLFLFIDFNVCGKYSNVFNKFKLSVLRLC